jgi:hypothetical protein
MNVSRMFNQKENRFEVYPRNGRLLGFLGVLDSKRKNVKVSKRFVSLIKIQKKEKFRCLTFKIGD